MADFRILVRWSPPSPSAGGSSSTPSWPPSGETLVGFNQETAATAAAASSDEQTEILRRTIRKACHRFGLPFSHPGNSDYSYRLYVQLPQGQNDPQRRIEVHEMTDLKDGDECELVVVPSRGAVAATTTGRGGKQGRVTTTTEPPNSISPTSSSTSSSSSSSSSHAPRPDAIRSSLSDDDAARDGGRNLNSTRRVSTTAAGTSHRKDAHDFCDTRGGKTIRSSQPSAPTASKATVATAAAAAKDDRRWTNESGDSSRDDEWLPTRQQPEDMLPSNCGLAPRAVPKVKAMSTRSAFIMCRKNQWGSILDGLRDNQLDPLMPISMANNLTTTVLHQAISSRSPDIQARIKVVDYILRTAPKAAAVKNDYGSLPLHSLAQRNVKMDSKSKARLIKRLVEVYPAGLKGQGGAAKRTPLHVLCTDYVSTELVQTMVDACPEACSIKDRKGYLPIHVLCGRHGAPAKLQLLLDANPDSLFATTNSGKTPLSIAQETATKNHPNCELIRALRNLTSTKSSSSSSSSSLSGTKRKCLDAAVKSCMSATKKDYHSRLHSAAPASDSVNTQDVPAQSTPTMHPTKRVTVKKKKMTGRGVNCNIK